MVSPFTKWYTTKTTKYAIETKAAILVYFKESSRRR